MSDFDIGLPNLFEYENYREYLKDAYQALKTKDKKYSFRYFARVAGFKAHSFLRLVMDGKSNLSPGSIEKIGKAFKFNSEQQRFFKNLVSLNQARTSEEKHHFSSELLKSKNYRKIFPLRESQYFYFSRWYYTVVRELVGLPGFKEDMQWIGRHTHPPISAAEAQDAVNNLLKLELLKRDENGKLVQASAVVSTPAEVHSAYVASWHKEYIKKGADSIDTVPRENRDISSVCLGFSKENIQVVKDLIANFRKEVVELAIRQPNRNALYQMNIQLFPLTDTTDEEGNS